MGNMRKWVSILIASFVSVLFIIVILPNFFSVVTASQVKPSIDFSLAPQQCCGSGSGGEGYFDPGNPPGQNSPPGQEGLGDIGDGSDTSDVGSGGGGSGGGNR